MTAALDTTGLGIPCSSGLRLAQRWSHRIDAAKDDARLPRAHDHHHIHCIYTGRNKISLSLRDARRPKANKHGNAIRSAAGLSARGRSTTILLWEFATGSLDHTKGNIYNYIYIYIYRLSRRFRKSNSTTYVTTMSSQLTLP